MLQIQAALRTLFLRLVCFRGSFRLKPSNTKNVSVSGAFSVSAPFSVGGGGGDDLYESFCAIFRHECYLTSLFRPRTRRKVFAGHWLYLNVTR